MRRREFITYLSTYLGGATLTWPSALSAQVSSLPTVPRIGVLIGGPDDADSKSKIDGFRDSLRQLGWSDGQNAKIDIRFGGTNAESIAINAKQIVELKPDVVLAGPTIALQAIRKETRTIPAVFVQVSDPVGQGLVDSLPRPGGNTTGFSNPDFTLLGKYLQTLKDIAPGITRVALMLHVSNAVSAFWYRQLHALASTFAIQAIDAPIRESGDIEKVVTTLAASPNGGLICPGDTFIEAPAVRALIIKQTAQSRIPTLYTNQTFVAEGGLVSYSIDQIDQWRRAASYVDRILKGEAPARLPVQEPTKFNLAINLKTAKALGLDIPLPLLGLADEVIE